MSKSASFRIKAILSLYILHYTVSFAFYLILCPACHCCSLRSFYHFWSILGLPSSTSCIFLNILEAICKPRIICPFPIMCSQPLWSDSVPFGLSVQTAFAYLVLRLLQWFNFRFLHGILILTDHSNQSFGFLHIVLRALYPSVTADAHLSRITPNGRGSTRQYMM